ncbi:MAG: histidine phosphatase family protein [Gemmatimonadota bacterium]
MSPSDTPAGARLPAAPPGPDVTRFLLVRHGETEYNREGRWQGAGSDPPLNPEGRRQARELARRLAGRPVAALYTSPQRRARETAAILGGTLGLDPEPVPELREIHHGEWEGKTQAEVVRGWPDEYRAYQADPLHTPRPGGETYEELGDRLWPALKLLADHHRDQEIVCVTHGGPVRLVLSRVLDRPLTERDEFGVENGSVFAVEESGGVWRLPGDA